MFNFRKFLDLFLLCASFGPLALPSVQYLSQVCVPNDGISEDIEANINCMIKSSYSALYAEEFSLGLEPIPTAAGLSIAESSYTTKLKSIGSEALPLLSPSLFTTQGIVSMLEEDPDPSENAPSNSSQPSSRKWPL